MAANKKMQQTVELHAPLLMQEAKHLMVEGDRLANTIILEVVEGGKPADLTGYSATAYMIRADGQKPFVKGLVVGNIVSVCLTEDFYAVPGRYYLFVRLTHTDGTKCTLLWLTGWIKDEGQGDVIDTGNVVPDLEDLLAQIDAMEKATAAANEAAANVEGFKDEINSQVNQLADDLGNLVISPAGTDFVSYTVGDNLFDKARITPGVIFLVSGDNIGSIGERPSGDNSIVFASYVRLTGTGTYTMPVASGIYGVTVSKINIYDRHKRYLETLTGVLNEDSTILTVQIDNEDAVYLGYSYYTSQAGSIMVVKGSEYPAQYSEYAGKNTLSGVAVLPEDVTGQVEVNNQVSQLTEDVNRIATVSRNLFDKSAVTTGSYYNGADGAIVDRENVYRVLIPVTAGSYTFGGSTGLFGTTVARVPLFDSSETYVTTITGEKGEEIDGGVVIRYTITQEDIDAGVTYAGYSGSTYVLDSMMYVKGTEYPAEYQTYGAVTPSDALRDALAGDLTLASDALYGKTVAFDGDSICNGGSAKDGKSGWAGRIGTANNMTWKNYAIGGGTITAETYFSGGGARHWISRNIDTIHEEMPDLDYLILEGGTNDADLLDESTQMGTFDLGDYSGVYDDTTFCGALETLLYKAVTYYPSAKIGFIIAHRMGYNQYTSDYDTTGSKRYRYFAKAMEICKKWAIPYLNLWDTSHMTPKLAAMYNQELDAAGNIAAGYLYTDGQHLTPAGYEHITPMIEAWMRTMCNAWPGGGGGVDETARRGVVDNAEAISQLSEEIEEQQSTLSNISIEGYERGGTYESVVDVAEKHENSYLYRKYVSGVGYAAVPVDVANWNWYELPANEGEKYHLITWCGNQPAAIYMLDEAGAIVQFLPDPLQSASQAFEGYFVIPAGVKTIRVNQQTQKTFVFERLGGQSLHFVRTKNAKTSEDHLYGKKLACVGDSITEATNPDGGYFANYAELAAARHNMTVYKDGKGGSTMTNVEGKNPFCVNRYLSVPADFDILTIWFGWNDNAFAEVGTIEDTEDTTYYGAYKKVLDYFITTYPTNKIGLIVPYGNANAEKFRVAVRALSEMYGVPCLDLADGKQCSLLWGTANAAQEARRAALTYDGTHPNQVGHEYLSTMYEEFIKRL